MRFKVIEEKILDEDPAHELGVEDYLNIVKENRDRLRSMASMLQTVSGLLLSVSFLILFFLIQEKLTEREVGIYILMFSATIVLIISLMFSLLAIYIRPPSPASTKGERLEQQLRIYAAEYRWVSIGLLLLFVAIFLFLICMIVFAVRLG